MAYSVRFSSLVLGLALLLGGAFGWSCTPIKVLMTRATGSGADVFENEDGEEVFGPKYPLTNVDTANVWGALKYVISETIDYDSGVDQAACTRKNGVTFIEFYVFEVCNTNGALWWSDPSNGQVGDSSTKGYGPYLAFDGGACTGDFCSTIYGGGDALVLGPAVGWQNQSDDARNPTDESYWYSLPGECPLQSWDEKEDDCVEEQPGGMCPEGVTPDGETCTYSYTFYGQVDLDEFVGIKSMGYANYTEFCQDGGKEFVRDPDTYDMVEGLEIWGEPLSRSANRARVEQLLEHYHDSSVYPMNKELPTYEELNEENAPCYAYLRECDEDNKCAYDDSQFCASCSDCEGPDYDAYEQPPELEAP